MSKIKIRGARRAVKNLNRQIRKIEGRTDKGLLAAAKFVEGESNENVPQKFGVLIGSSFSRLGGKLLAVVGYTAKYAPFVHEMPDTYNFTKPGTGPRFLLNALTHNTKTILQIIQRRIKI